ncbi:MAG: SIS domain-containing protein [Planctomycetota bacterium]|jgi:glucosamine--fructose-6-phosphate aminotransferase (isomerizing)
MCGIIGYLTGEKGGSLQPTAVLEALQGLDPEGNSPEDYQESGRKAETLSLSLLRPEAAVFLEDPPLHGAVSTAIGRLSKALKTAEEKACRPGTPLSEVEAWNAASVRFRNAIWRLEEDLLANHPRTVDLCRKHLKKPEAKDPGQMLRHAFRLNVVLNALDRLEVRGRDSAGVGTIVWFPDPSSYSAFCRGVAGSAHREAWETRRAKPDLVSGAVVSTGGDRPSLIFVHKTAEEIGRYGQNVARLREAIEGDPLYWAAVGTPGTQSEFLAHTRWASNGIVNEPNCHPVDDRSAHEEEGPRFLAVLNGDIDNFQALRDDLSAAGRRQPANVTTDAKVIPMLVAAKYRETGDVAEAFRGALNAFEGAFAIGLMCTAEPGVIRLAIKGSGQAMYVGKAAGGVVFASETYGLVEVSHRYLRMDGELPRVAGARETAGQTLRLQPDAVFPGGLDLRSFDGEAIPAEPEVFDAEITTRDVHRGKFEHYFFKEISESPESLERTIRGKFFFSGEGGEAKPVFAFGPETVPPDVMAVLKDSKVRRILFIGQGTASVASKGIAELWASLFPRKDLVFSSVKASELSGFGLERDMSDTLVVAVSQSGTTTDTNRTVELVKGRGARVLGIVNRRHSDLVHRVDGVVYTGDGRDVEMAVASTKAFYAQVAAGYLLGLYIAHTLRTLSDEEVMRRLQSLERLPDLLRETLRRAEGIRKHAEVHALRKRHWAVVGSGLDRVAAEEIRIKLSELNYKSISCDFLEDKKHIDLSAEPLILVCTVSQLPANIPDAVKEVSIFRAHRATPIVIVPDGEDRYGPYASAQIPVPVGVPELAFLLETMAGHLWGYFAARAIDGGADLLKEARGAVVQAVSAVRTHTGVALAGALRLLRGRITPLSRAFFRNVRGGLYNSGLEVETASNLQTLFGYLQGQIPLRDFPQDFGDRGTWGALLDRFLTQVSRGIGELTRPIDAIKHQAKTVTVGISREEISLTGPLFEALQAASFPTPSLDDAKRAVLEAATRAVASVVGLTLYDVEGLDVTGMPTDRAMIRIVHQSGIASSLPSRATTPRPLFGTKRRVFSHGRVWLGSGRSDGRPIVLIPGMTEEGKSPLALLHVEYRTDLSLEDTLHVLRGYYERYDEIRWAASEIDPAFSDAKLEGFPILSLLEEDPNALAQRILKEGEGKT